jgi:hypothetical protein
MTFNKQDQITDATSERVLKDLDDPENAVVIDLNNWQMRFRVLQIDSDYSYPDITRFIQPYAESSDHFLAVFQAQARVDAQSHFVRAREICIPSLARHSTGSARR